jgi:CRP-like cAMP-binding protein
VIAKNTIADSPGHVATTFYFILSGIGRVYYFADGNEITDYFAWEGQFIGALDSLFSGKPGLFGVQFLEETHALCLRYSDLNRLYSRYHELEHIGRIIATQSYLDELTRTKAFQTVNAKERYKILLQTEAHLLQRVSLGHIASYLGISQVQLSRIRGEV